MKEFASACESITSAYKSVALQILVVNVLQILEHVLQILVNVLQMLFFSIIQYKIILPIFYNNKKRCYNTIVYFIFNTYIFYHAHK